ncbi:SPOR domain-containing protein [Oceanicoccus sp. KOV_DT_Chl]|uniref:SPOR domain-containing protein n=1 Tax=Oceanicoccus sp. KOV_DT_Chl TaxID=1904639 RepID=UPI000C7CD019|nr:SPOR domain-containing protein [Oceanicoccus sp. KOV_DT_Chl]
MRWILIVLLMCNGIYFLWQNYLLQNEIAAPSTSVSVVDSETATLQLLSELDQVPQQGDGNELVAKAAAPAKNVEVAIAEPEEAGICWLIGPFQEEISGKQVVSRLAALDISLHLQAIEIPGKPDYWVHLPPQLSRKAAIKLLRELQAKKIDSFLITEGELADGISLGFFTEKVRADKVLKQRIEQGYPAVIKVVPRTRAEIWAIFDSGEYSKFSDALWDKIKQGNKGLERRKNYCDKIASTNNFD